VWRLLARCRSHVVSASVVAAPPAERPGPGSGLTEAAAASGADRSSQKPLRAGPLALQSPSRRRADRAGPVSPFREFPRTNDCTESVASAGPSAQRIERAARGTSAPLAWRFDCAIARSLRRDLDQPSSRAHPSHYLAELLARRQPARGRRGGAAGSPSALATWAAAARTAGRCAVNAKRRT
jgi:hypothetical protein